MPENSVKRYLTYNIIKLKSFLLSKDVLSFLVFLFLSATFWFLNALNEERELTLSLPVQYKGIPPDIQFRDRLPDEVNIKLKDQGVNLWTYVLNRPRKVELFIDHTFKEQGIVSITSAQLQSAVGQLLLPTTLIQVVSPGNTAANYYRLHAKKVPVRLQASITPADQFMLNNNIRIVPDSVVVYGSYSLVDNIKNVVTANLLINNLKDTLISEVQLMPDDSLRYSVKTVKVISSAEMFTEKSINLPVQIINQPEQLSVRSFPAEVRVVFNIALSQFRNFSPGDIQILIDFNEIKLKSGNKHRLKVISYQPYISNVRIKPEEVEFLLEEK